jgi:dTMP kinase
MFVTFEGIDGSGKSTLIQSLDEHLRTQGHPVVTTHEPGDGTLGWQLRPILLDLKNKDLSDRAELFLYLADRAQHVHEMIAPILSSGAIILCDRFIDSTVAYQGYGRGLNLAMLRNLNDIATAAVVPDLTLVLDIDPEIALSRAKARNAGAGTIESEGRFEALALDFHKRVRRGFLELAAAEPGRIRVIDAARDYNSVFKDGLRLVEERMAHR